MNRSEVEAGLTQLAEEVAEARAALARGDDEIGLENVGPRIESLVAAAVQLPPDEAAEMQQLMTQVRDDLQALSQALGDAIEAAKDDDEAEEDGGEGDRGNGAG
jgi:uncharacterized membrane protein YccC